MMMCQMQSYHVGKTLMKISYLKTVRKQVNKSKKRDRDEVDLVEVDETDQDIEEDTELEEDETMKPKTRR